MAKSVIKEIIIVLLLSLAIVLILGILFYEYIPISKEVPDEVQYSASSEVEAKKSEIDTLKVESDYESSETDSVTSTDLNNYERVKDYRPGKANPFGPYETTATDPTGSGSSTGGSSSSSGSSSGTTGGSSSTSTDSNDDDSSSGGHFFQNTGTK